MNKVPVSTLKTGDVISISYEPIRWAPSMPEDTQTNQYGTFKYLPAQPSPIPLYTEASITGWESIVLAATQAGQQDTSPSGILASMNPVYKALCETLDDNYIVLMLKTGPVSSVKVAVKRTNDLVDCTPRNEESSHQAIDLLIRSAPLGEIVENVDAITIQDDYREALSRVVATIAAGER